MLLNCCLTDFVSDSLGSIIEFIFIDNFFFSKTEFSHTMTETDFILTLHFNNINFK